MALFESDAEFALFLSFVEAAKTRHSFYLHAFCPMTNHFHLFVEIGDTAASKFMQEIESNWAQYFNRTRDRTGHVFQGRYRDKLCADEAYYLNILRYIANNPVKAGLVPSAADWPWSSHKQLISETPGSMLDRDRVLARLGGTAERGLAAYRSHMESAAFNDFEIALDLFPDTEERAFFAPWADGDALAWLNRTAAEVEGAFGLAHGTLRREIKSKPAWRARIEFCRIAAEHGISQADLARFLGVSVSRVSRVLSK